MSLRRIKQHLEQENWFALALDFFIVVSGILIAFQINTWNEARVDLDREYEYLIRLHEDFAASETRLERETQQLQEQLNDQDLILAALDSCTLEPKNRRDFSRGLVRMGAINSPMYIKRTIDELISNGEMGLIRNTVLRKNIADMTAQIAWRASLTDAIQRQTESHRFVVDQYVRYGVPDIKPNEDANNKRQGFPTADFDLQTLCQEPGVAASVSNVSLNTRERRQVYLTLLEDYSKILSQLEEELQSEWDHEIEDS